MALVPLLSLFSRGLTINGVGIFPGLDMRDVDHSFATVWIAHTIFALPLAVFLLHNFIAEIPQRSDRGGSGGRCRTRPDLLPASSCRWRSPRSRRSPCCEFIWVWNDLLVATIFAPSTSLPMTQSLNSLSGTWGNQWYLQAAGTFIIDPGPADRVLRSAALLRSRAPGGGDKGLISSGRQRGHTPKTVGVPAFLCLHDHV